MGNSLSFSRFLAPSLTLIIAVGCSSATNTVVTPIVKVKGKVMYDGKPLPTSFYRVTFLPDADKGNKNKQTPNAILKEAGAYELSAPSGWYKVVLTTSTASIPPDKTVKIDPKYVNPDETPLVVEAVANPAPGGFDLSAGVASAVETPIKTPDVPPVKIEKPPSTIPGPTPTPGPTSPAPPSAPLPPLELVDDPIINFLVMLCLAMALLVLVAEVIHVVGLVNMTGAAKTARKGKGHHGHEGEHQHSEPAAVRHPPSPWGRVIPSAITILALLIAAEMIRLASRMEQRMDYLTRTR